MTKEYEVIIIGSGFGGLAAAVQLLKKGVSNFIFLEREEAMGGTWLANTYPGAQVDVESHLYALSFEPNDWTRVYAKQHEILKYTNHVIDKYGLRNKGICNANVTACNFDEQKEFWEVSTEDGNTYRGKFIINASGGLSQPKIPAFKNMDSFKGHCMHTANWDHAIDYKDKKVAVIGTAASAIQVIPAIAPYVEHLHVLQRTPHWILPRPDRAFTTLERNTFKNFPMVRKAYRNAIYSRYEARVLAFQYVNDALKLFQIEAKQHIKSKVPKRLQKTVTPDYLMGCKRILLSNEYYPTLGKENVTLLPKSSGIDSFFSKGIKTIDGQDIELDVVVFATGFHTSENFIVYPIIGKYGKSLEEAWSDYAHAYLGTMIPGFPNFLLLGGPNTGTGHTSAIGLLEAQIEYIIRVIDDRQKKQWSTIEVKLEVEAQYNKELQKDLKRSVWSTGGCDSWYLTESGINTTMYPRFTFLFKRDCKNYKQSDHVFT